MILGELGPRSATYGTPPEGRSSYCARTRGRFVVLRPSPRVGGKCSQLGSCPGSARCDSWTRYSPHRLHRAHEASRALSRAATRRPADLVTWRRSTMQQLLEAVSA